MNFQNYLRIISLLVIFLAGCSPLSQPFKPNKSKLGNSLVKYDLGNDVAINKVKGTSPEMGVLLSQAVANQLIQNNIIAYLGDRGSSPYVLDGRVEGWRGGDATAPPLVVRWTLRKKNGEIVGVYIYKVTGSGHDWNYNPELFLDNIGKTTASVVFNKIAVRPIEIFSKVDTKKSIWVKSVRNAPGDGNIALVRAIKYALSDSGTNIVESQKNADLILSGEVAVTSPVSGLQQVEILWNLNHRGGGRIGQLRQKNSMTAGTLDEKWGGVALDIAFAAIRAIQKMSKNTFGPTKKKEERDRLNAIKFKPQDTNVKIPLPSLSPE